MPSSPKRRFDVENLSPKLFGISSPLRNSPLRSLKPKEDYENELSDIPILELPDETPADGGFEYRGSSLIQNPRLYFL